MEESAFTFLALGGIIQEFRIASLNIVQGFPTSDLYKRLNSPFFGETIGRTTNRLKDGKIVLNGKTISLFKNNGPNSLHGGKEGWGKKTFEGPKAVSRNGREGVLFTYLSRDGEEGYPGTVELRVWYTAGKEKEREDGVEKTVLEMEYEVEFVGDECEETFVGVTNHRSVRTYTIAFCCKIDEWALLMRYLLYSYFNLSGKPTIEGTEATLHTTQYLPLDDTAIPTGTITSYPNLTPYQPFTLGPTDPDIDDCFIVNTDPSSIPLDTRTQPLNPLASFSHPLTNIHLEVLSTEPAFQFYTGKFINVPAAEEENVPARGPRSGFCVEPSRYVNAPNVDEWKGMCLVKRGQIWGSKTVYKAWRA